MWLMWLWGAIKIANRGHTRAQRKRCSRRRMSRRGDGAVRATGVSKVMIADKKVTLRPDTARGTLPHPLGAAQRDHTCIHDHSHITVSVAHTSVAPARLRA